MARFRAAVRKSLLLKEALGEVASNGVIQGNYPPVIGQFRSRCCIFGTARRCCWTREGVRSMYTSLRLLSLWSSDQRRSAKRLHVGNWSWKQLRCRTAPPMRYFASSLRFIVISLAIRLHRENSS